jgi:outer membrane receptor for ferrienterochelin and colicins
VLSDLTVNYGLRYDNYTAYSSGDQLSPRLNAVYKPWDGTTFHLGYARYFSPPPFELVGNEDIAKFSPTPANPTAGTSATPQITTGHHADRRTRQLFRRRRTAAGHRRAARGNRQLLQAVEGHDRRRPVRRADHSHTVQLRQGQAIWRGIDGRLHGREFQRLCQSRRSNMPSARAGSRSQFSFLPDQFLYTQNHYIDLDHEQHFSASGGASYKWGDTLFDTDLIYGTGLREDTGPLPEPSRRHSKRHACACLRTGQYRPGAGLLAVFGEKWKGFTARFDVINLFDEKY